MRLWAFIGVCAVSSAPAAYYAQPLVRDNSDAVLIVTTVMTVFAGFLVAILAVLGDPSMMPAGSWRTAEMQHEKIEYAVIRHTYLFYFYLAAVGLMFVGVLIQKAPDSDVPAWIRRAIEMAYLFVGIFSFLLTLALPTTLAQIQLARSDAEIERRRAEEGIKPFAPSEISKL